MTAQLMLHGKIVTKEAMVAFKQAYLEARAKKATEFLFDTHRVLVDYAKFVVEYAESQLGPL